jgi:acetyltransferase-like isoleucine patch superfamily enzyme
MKLILLIKKVLKKRAEYKKAGCNLFIIGLRFLYYYLFFGKKIIAHQRAIIRGVRNIKMMTKNSIFFVGVSYRGFLVKSDLTLIDVQGELKIWGDVRIARLTRIAVCKGAVLELYNGVGINSNCFIVCGNKIVFKEHVGIAWNCQFLDTDLHEISFLGGTSKSKPIIIGEEVIIGHDVSIGKGVEIAEYCTIESDSVIKRSFLTPKCTIFTERKYRTVQNRVVIRR